jgi:hypothetical protein
MKNKLGLVFAGVIVSVQIEKREYPFFAALKLNKIENIKWVSAIGILV